MSDIVGAVEELNTEIGAIFKRAGVRGRHITCGAIVGYEYRLPTGHVVRAHIAPPTEVGGRLGRKIRRKLKKIVKNKALKALGKVARMAASFIPGGSAVAQAAEMGVKAAQAMRNARVSGDPQFVGALAPSIREGARELRAVRQREWA